MDTKTKRKGIDRKPPEFHHGENDPPTAEYAAWRGMYNRCYNKNLPLYNRYGGRGITVCSDWLGDGGYQRFLAYLLQSIGRRPHASLSLDRIDNNKGYEPGNIRWASKEEQMRNSTQAKLSEEIVDKLKQEYTGRGVGSAYSLAAKYGVSRSTIMAAIKGKTWYDTKQE